MIVDGDVRPGGLAGVGGQRGGGLSVRNNKLCLCNDAMHTHTLWLRQLMPRQAACSNNVFNVITRSRGVNPQVMTSAAADLSLACITTCKRWDTRQCTCSIAALKCFYESAQYLFTNCDVFNNESMTSGVPGKVTSTSTNDVVRGRCHSEQIWQWRLRWLLSALVLLHKYRDYRELWSEIKLVQTFAVTRNTAGYFNNINSFILRKKCLTVSHIYYGDVQLSTSELFFDDRMMCA